MTLHESLNISVTQFPVHKDGSSLSQLLWALDELICAKCLQQGVAQGRYQVLSW